MSEAQLQAFLATLLGTGLIAAVPLTLAALGETFAELAGLLNLGIEGMMLSGAFFGFAAALATGSLAVGLAAGIGAGLILGLGFGLLTITLRVNQILVGLAITIVGLGLTGFLFQDSYGQQFPRLSVHVPEIAIPLLRRIPILGPGLFAQQILVYVTFALVAIAGVVLTRTRFGLEVRAAGENPFAADAAGVSVARTRYLAIALGGALAGLAGAFLSVADLQFFNPGMTVGQGFIAIALAMLGRWRPARVLAGAVLFGVLESLSTGLQILGVAVRPEFVNMLPYVGIMVALVVLAGRAMLPAALAVPYERGERTG